MLHAWIGLSKPAGTLSLPKGQAPCPASGGLSIRPSRRKREGAPAPMPRSKIQRKNVGATPGRNRPMADCRRCGRPSVVTPAKRLQPREPRPIVEPAQWTPDLPALVRGDNAESFGDVLFPCARMNRAIYSSPRLRASARSNLRMPWDSFCGRGQEWHVGKKGMMSRGAAENAEP